MFPRTQSRYPLLTLACVAGAALVLAPAVLAHGTPARSMSIGGQVVPTGTFPWAVALEHTPMGSDTPVKFCGGTLIAPRYVLTAGHCSELESLDTAADLRRERVAVRFANLDGQPAIAATRMTIPGSYWYSMWGQRQQSDIAVVQLASAAPTAPQAISRAVPAQGSPVTSLGYGTIPETRRMSDDLRQIWSLASAPAACGGRSAGGLQAKVFPATEICIAAGPSDTVPPLDGGTCGGDSGSPLLGNDLAAVVGVVSWGRLNNCLTPPGQRSSVFAQPGPVAAWLRRQTGASLFGDPAVAVDRAGPVGATLRRGRVVGTRLPVQVGARGGNWRAMVYVQFGRDAGARIALQTVALSLGPARPAGVVQAPASWGPRPAGLEVVDVAARIWRPDNLNGVTLHAE